MAKQKIEDYKREKLTIQIDTEACISCGSCTVVAPNTFELDENLKCQIKPDPIDSTEDVVSAGQNCAVGAITLIDNKTSKKLWPEE
ncbi:MAG: ferredoxin [Patescibacteria group bacterium]|nr:ferredoxin [Patescibacteria group bacterium]